jgi:hypothetical protein
MKGLFTFLLILGSALCFSQVNYKVLPNVKTFKQWTVNLSEESNNLEIAGLKGDELAPEPGMQSHELKKTLDAKRKRKLDYKNKSTYLTEKDSILPELMKGFNGRPSGGSGIPNDNSMAISNDGIIISVINTTVTILDSDGNLLLYRTLNGITQGQLGVLDRYYDPKVTYDPINDRFILMFLEGSLSSDTRIVVGFSQTSDPTGDWNFYAIDGRPLGGETWSDYPIIAHNKEDLYITVNLLRDNESWQEGFVQSFIWQINKEDGYNADNLTQNLFYDIEFNGKPTWSICPVQPALDFDHDNMYFLSVRPDAESNDTVFLHEITNTSKSGQATHNLSVLKSNKNYGVPPSAFQPFQGFRLQTNDTRVLSATIHRNRIHYVQSSIVPETLTPGIYHGVISNLNGDASIDAEIISSDTLDYAYPSIAFAGVDAEDEHSMLITFSHSSEEHFPGTSAIFQNRIEGREGLYSDPLIVKEGEGVISTFLPNDAERWGDYTDIQRKYDEPGVVWLCGSYGDANNRNNVWIAKLKAKNDVVKIEGFVTYPNPVADMFKVATVFPEDDVVRLILTDLEGRIVKELKDVAVEAGGKKFLVRTDGLSSGLYVLAIFNDEDEKLHSETIVVE